jgi:hypothetical protein
MVVMDDPRPLVKLSTPELARLLGISRSTVKRRFNDATGQWVLPPGWTWDTEQRPQGEVYVFYLPADDPLLTRPTAQPGTSPGADTPTGDVPEAVPEAVQDAPEPVRHVAVDEGPSSEPRLTIPEIRDALIAPLVGRLADVDRQASARMELIGALREQVGGLRVQVEMGERLLGVKDAEVGSLRVALASQEQLTEELRQLLAVEREARGRAENRVSALEIELQRPSFWRRLLAVLSGHRGSTG